MNFFVKVKQITGRSMNAPSMGQAICMAYEMLTQISEQLRNQLPNGE